MARFSLELSDGLKELSELFIPFEHEPMVLDPDDARAMRRCIKLLHEAARCLENEISRHRWNEPALRQQIAEARHVTAEAARPNSNVLLFPAVPRPLPDGLGGAA